MSTEQVINRLNSNHRTDLITNGYIREIENIQNSFSKKKKNRFFIPTAIRDIILKNIDGDLELNKGTFEWILCEDEKLMPFQYPRSDVSDGEVFKIGHLDWQLTRTSYHVSHRTEIYLILQDMPKDWKSVEFKVTIFTKGTNKNKIYDKAICYNEEGHLFPDPVHLLYLTNDEVLYLCIKSVF